MSVNQKSWLVPVAFANIFIIWGAAYIAISYGLEGFPPFILSTFRFLTAGAILIVYRYLKKERASSLVNWKKNAITGLLILTGGTGLIGWGEQYVSSAEAAIAIATGPFWFIAFDRKNWRYYFSDKFIITGLMMGFAGLLLFLKGSIQPENANGVTIVQKIIAFGVLAGSSVSWVLGSLYAKNRPSGHSTVMNIAQQLLIAGAGAAVIALFRGEWMTFRLNTVPLSAWSGLIFLVLMGSIVTYLSYIWLLSVKPPALVSTYTYINPVVAVFLGWILANERITPVQMSGLAVILSGVLLTNFNRYKLSRRFQVKLRKLNRYLLRLPHTLIIIPAVSARRR